MWNNRCVGVTLVVRSHRFAVGVNRGGEVGKDSRVCRARRESENRGLEPRGQWERAQYFLKILFFVKPSK